MTIDYDAKMPETQEGTEVYNVDPLTVKSHYEIDYIHSYAQDSNSGAIRHCADVEPCERI